MIRTPLAWMTLMSVAAVVGACGNSTSSEFADGGLRDGGGTSSGGSSGSGSGGGASGSGSGGSLISGDAAMAPGDGGGHGVGCPIATLGAAGQYGQGDLFMDWLSGQGESS